MNDTSIFQGIKILKDLKFESTAANPTTWRVYREINYNYLWVFTIDKKDESDEQLYERACTIFSRTNLGGK
jgi:hypothetical protein